LERSIIVLPHNDNDSDSKVGISLLNDIGEVAMKNVSRLRAMGSLCRQQAAYSPDRRWKLLAEAEYWEHLAQLEMSSYFKDSNTMSPSELAGSKASPNSIDAQWETIAAASVLSCERLGGFHRAE
jgi:hypothetical protein